MRQNDRMVDGDDIYYIDLIRSGDKGAYSYLVGKYSDMVYSLALKMLKNEADAEDLSQEIFIAAYKSLSRFKGNARFSTWLYRITYNRSVSRLRRSRRELFTDKVQYLERNGESEELLLESSMLEENLQQLQLAVKKLKDEEQLLIMLHYFEDQSIDEVAAITGLSSSNVKVRLFRIRKKLKEQLEQYQRAIV